MGKGDIISSLSVRPVRAEDGFRALSCENIDVTDSYVIQRYIIMKYRSNSIKDKIHISSTELWPLPSKWFPLNLL